MESSGHSQPSLTEVYQPMFHSYSIHVPFMFHLCSSHVPLLFHTIYVYVPLLFHTISLLLHYITMISSSYHHFCWGTTHVCCSNHLQQKTFQFFQRFPKMFPTCSWNQFGFTHKHTLVFDVSLGL
jgi:hypothetical protein